MNKNILIWHLLLTTSNKKETFLRYLFLNFDVIGSS